MIEVTSHELGPDWHDDLRLVEYLHSRPLEYEQEPFMSGSWEIQNLMEEQSTS